MAVGHVDYEKYAKVSSSRLNSKGNSAYLQKLKYFGQDQADNDEFIIHSFKFIGLLVF